MYFGKNLTNTAAQHVSRPHACVTRSSPDRLSTPQRLFEREHHSGSDYMRRNFPFSFRITSLITPRKAEKSSIGSPRTKNGKFSELFFLFLLFFADFFFRGSRIYAPKLLHRIAHTHTHKMLMEEASNLEWFWGKTTENLFSSLARLSRPRV